MRTDASGKLILKNEQQENMRNTRKTLKVLQQAATDKENLVGRPHKSKELLPKTQSDSDIDSRRKIKVSHKYVQTTSGIKVDTNDLTSEAGPSENYWEIIAERRRLALDESLQENQKLHEENEALKEENKLVKEMLEESKNLVEVLSEMLGETNEQTTGETEETIDE